MRPLLLLAALGALAGCEPAEVPVRNEGAPGAPGFAWQGAFAVSPELCTGGQWRVGERSVETDGELSCTIRQIEQQPAKVALGLNCTAEGMESEESWRITPFGERGITVHRDAGLDLYEIDLIRCP